MAQSGGTRGTEKAERRRASDGSGELACEQRRAEGERCNTAAKQHDAVDEDGGEWRRTRRVYMREEERRSERSRANVGAGIYPIGLFGLNHLNRCHAVKSDPFSCGSN